ncbi:MAG: metal ABC transporter substrate-binding protein [Planctomycetota bacterium]|jgi:zinc transport system substrate-binding protein
MRRRISIILMISLVLSIIGCKKEQPETVESASDEEVKVFASNYPLSYFAERISGKSEIVIFPEIDGDPAFWEPEPADIIMMQQSDIILLNGATYEKWLTGIALPKRKIVDTSKAFKEQYTIIKEVADHLHGPGGEHSHSGTAFTTWIDLNQAAFQAKAIKDAMAKQNISSEEVLNRNFESLIEDLRVLDTQINKIAQGHSKVPLIASHPVYQYFARRYGLNIKAMYWEPDVFPDEQMWKHLEEIVKEHPAKWMIWEAEPLPQSVAKLKEMGINSIVFDPCGNKPKQGDFLGAMKENVGNLKKMFEN